MMTSKMPLSAARPAARTPERAVLFLFLGLALVRGLLYAAITPPWQSPDENGHFEYAWLVAHLGRLPDRADVSPSFERELLGSLYEYRYGELIGRPLPEPVPARFEDLPQRIFAVRSRSVVGRRFSLAYVWMALFIRPVRHQDLVVQLYAARVASVVLQLGVVGVGWLIFRRLLPARPDLVAAMTAFLVFLPQHTFINAGAGEGALAELAACVVLYGWVSLLLRRDRALGVGCVVLGTAVGMYAKNTAAFLLPFDLLALVYLGRRRLSGLGRDWRWGYLVGGVVIVVLLLAVVLMAPVGRKAQSVIQVWWSTPQVRLETENATLDHVLMGTFNSFWALFGWMAAPAGRGWYGVVYVLTLVALEGWILPRTRSWAVPAEARWLVGTFFLASFFVWLVFVVGIPGGFGYYQGRYLFPGVVSVAFFMVGGWSRWAPGTIQDHFPLLVTVLLAGLDAGAVCLALWPFALGG